MQMCLKNMRNLTFSKLIDCNIHQIYMVCLCLKDSCLAIAVVLIIASRNRQDGNLQKASRSKLFIIKNFMLSKLKLSSNIVQTINMVTSYLYV